MQTLWFKSRELVKALHQTQLLPANRHAISKMTNKKPTKPTKRHGNALLPIAKNTQARRAAVLQKKAATPHARGRGRKAAMDTGDESVHSTPPKRRSSRLKGPTPDTPDTVLRAHSHKSTMPLLAERRSTAAKDNANQGSEPRYDFSFLSGDDRTAPTEEDAQSDAGSGLGEIQDLRRQLQQERGFHFAIP